ncbi:MAG: ATP-binding protein [Bacteroidales bacterium]|nr:ATP-binding protein [Bacteroidales bacterium]
MSYLHRTADIVLSERLEAFGAVLIEGPKWCGKTTTAEQIAKSVIRLQDTDKREEYLATAASKPSLLLHGDTPRLIDEWQDAPVLWDAVRTMVDKRNEPGQFILTGSNSVDKNKILHSGTGRISRMKMLPMSLWESGESNGKISLLQLFDDPSLDIDGITSDMEVEDLIFAACRGGWPATINIKSQKAKLLVARDYVNSVCREDISRVDNVQRDERVARLLLRSYARNISTLAKNTSLLADIVSSEEVSISMPTFDDYVAALTKLFVICNIDAWCPAIRSKTTIRSGYKRAFIDPSIAVASLGLTPEALHTQFKTFGFIFEQMCARDLKAYTPDFDTHLSYYRDRYGLEADLVLHLADGRYALIECMLGSKEIEEGASHLIELKRLIQEHNKKEEQVPLREPDLLIILTGGHMAYTRPDGVKIIPLATLRQ